MSFFRVLRRTVVFFIAMYSANLMADDADLEAGKNLYDTCWACHGKNGEGVPVLKGPALAGLSEKYLVSQLDKFLNKHRGNDPRDEAGQSMTYMVLSVNTPQAMADVAAYIASFTSQKRPATLDGDAQNGKSLYMTCAACHGQQGQGLDALNAPSLVNQHDWYLFTQLKHFKEGIRGAHPQDGTGAQMRAMTMVLTDDQAIKDVVAYIQTFE